jgi:Bacterial Ig-like domain (group 3)
MCFRTRSQIPPRQRRAPCRARFSQWTPIRFLASLTILCSTLSLYATTRSVFVHAAVGTPATPTTWYVRPDGGTRFSANRPAGQCNGMADAPYPGTGVNQQCAFRDIRYLWADGSYATGMVFPAWGWVGSGGDTYIIDCPNDCRIGYSGPNNSPSDYFLGKAGNPYGSGAPPPPNGSAATHTRILGKHHASCTSDAVKAHINGGYGVSPIFSLQGSSYVDLACFNITDHSDCVRSGGMPNQCQTSLPKSDYATNGIQTSNTTTNTTITDVRVHGMVGAGIIGPTGNGVVVERVAVVGNHSSGWNMDASDGTTGTGDVTLDHVSILWNGCSEEYPIVDALPYGACNDQNSGGYGDGLGTATITSSPAWHMTITNSTAAFNTQDGFDLLHLQGNGSILTVAKSLMYGNMGQQLKVGAASISRNNLIVGNCNALRQAIPGTPAGYNSHLSDFCRAANTMVALNVEDSTPTYFQFNTMYSANATGVQIGCNGTCTTLASIIYENNIFVGFQNSPLNGAPLGSGQNANPIYLVGVPMLFTNPGTVFSHNATFHQRSNWACPHGAFNEADATCGDPQLVDETWHLFGYGDMSPILSSPVIQNGMAVTGVTTDYKGATRPNPPSIGALESGANPVGQQITIDVSPNPATISDTVLLETAVIPPAGFPTPATGEMTFMDGDTSLGMVPLDNLGNAMLDVSKLLMGPHGIMAVYSGDANHPAWGSGIVVLQVNSPTTTTLSTPSAVVTYGQSLSLVAKVIGTGSAVPPGTVTFLNGSAILGTPTLSASGVANLTRTLAVGSYSITARNAGGGSFLGSGSNTVVVSVVK